MKTEQPISTFKEKKIRRTQHMGAWWYVVKDVVDALKKTCDSIGYIKIMKKKDPSLAEVWKTITIPLQNHTAGGRQYINCSNKEGLFRILQSLPSPHVEAFKIWLEKEAP